VSRPVPAPVPASTEQVKLQSVEVLSDHWYTLRKVTFDLRRRDGQWQTLSREAYDRGNGAALLLYDPRRRTVVLTRQFRLPAFLNGSADGMLIETCAGLLDGDDPETCIRREAEEETGYRVRQPRKVFEAYMSPGSVTEKLHFFIAEYEPQPHRRWPRPRGRGHRSDRDATGRSPGGHWQRRDRGRQDGDAAAACGVDAAGGGGMRTCGRRRR
jgi:nudix-type nucleoside diphosphatase (YffH/AdpP family)